MLLKSKGAYRTLTYTYIIRKVWSSISFAVFFFFSFVVVLFLNQYFTQKHSLPSLHGFSPWGQSMAQSSRFNNFLWSLTPIDQLLTSCPSTTTTLPRLHTERVVCSQLPPGNLEDRSWHNNNKPPVWTSTHKTKQS